MYNSIYKWFSWLPAIPSSWGFTKSYLYGASALMAAANSGSHLSPLASSFSGDGVSIDT